MARGKVSPLGATMVSDNGYHYTKVMHQGSAKWRLTHHIVAERILGRALTEADRVEFIDKDRKNLSPKNIRVVPKGKASVRRRLAQITARIQELEAEKAELESSLESNKV